MLSKIHHGHARTQVFYQGRYIPVFAAAVYDQNAKLAEAGLTPINLSSVMIGRISSHLPDLSITLAHYTFR